jgi:hypothetical protein
MALSSLILLLFLYRWAAAACSLWSARTRGVSMTGLVYACTGGG